MTPYFLVGYPGSDNFNTFENHYGNGQYHCAGTWDTHYTSAENPDAAPLVGTGYFLNMTGCEMNGGASGGPVFQRLDNGRWVITGVNNIGAPDETTGLGANMAWQWFGNNFAQFYCSVLPCSGARARIADSGDRRALALFSRSAAG